MEGPSLLGTAVACQVCFMTCPPLHFTHCPPGPPYLLTARPHPPHLCLGCAPDREEATRDHTSLTASSKSCPEAQGTFGDHTQRAGRTAKGNDGDQSKQGWLGISTAWSEGPSRERRDHSSKFWAWQGARFCIERPSQTGAS